MKTFLTSSLFGVLALIFLLGVYFGLLTLLSGWSFTLEQFFRYWPFVISLVVGFGVQVGLYVYLRVAIRQQASGRVVATTGTTSTLAMISCCAHYLVNILPIIGATGFVALVAQYQTQLFWVGLLFNLAGVFYIGRKVFLFRSSMAYA